MYNELTIDQLYEKIDSNNERLSYLKSKNWFYQLWFMKTTNTIKEQNKILHNMIIDKVYNLV